MMLWRYILPIFSLLLLQIELTWCARKAIKSVHGPKKKYTGYRVSEDSQMIAYHHAQIVAVVELAARGHQMINCELLEVKNGADLKATLKLLNSLKIKKQKAIPFEYMLELQQRCQDLDTPAPFKQRTSERSSQDQSNPFAGLSSVFSGIFPGTKWCGKGDLAPNYHVLGSESEADKCCRTHDFCPVKVSGMSTQYDITNDSLVARSHCACDKLFYECLKRAKSFLTDVIGGLYFDVGDPQCMEESEDYDFEFRPNELRYDD